MIILLAFEKKNANNTPMIRFVTTDRKIHRHHIHAGCMLAI